jgi:hypothetical protein
MSPNSILQLDEKERAVIVARLEVLPPDIHFSSGGPFQNISRDEMIKHVENGDKIGKEYVRIEMDFLRAFKSGELFKTLETLAA